MSERERMLRVMTDSTTDMLSYWDTGLRCLYANAAYLDWFGRSPAQMRDLSLLELLGSELYCSNERHVIATLAGTEQKFERSQVKAIDGSVRYTLVRYIPDILLGVVKGFVAMVTDITEIKSASVAAAKSEQRLRVALAHASVTVFEQDLQLRYQWLANSTLGYSVEQVVGKTDAELIDSAYVPAIATLKQQIIETGQPLRAEVVARASGRDKPIYDVDISASPVYDEKGQISGLIGAVTNITNRKKEDKRLRMLVANSPAGMALSRVSDGIFIEINDAFLNMCGYAREEVIGRTSEELYLWPDPVERRQRLAEFKVKRQIQNFTTQIRQKSGRIIPVLGSIHLTAFDGEDHLFGVLIDMSELERVLNELHISEERFRILASATFEGVAVTKYGRIVDVNQQLLDMIGYAREELVGRLVTEIVPEQGKQAIESAIRSGKESRIEHAFVHKDGRQLMLETHGQAVGAPENSMRVTAIRNITERKQQDLQNERYRQQLENINAELVLRTQQAEHASATKSRFLTSVNHELRTPLHTILGYTRLLVKSTEGEVLRQLETIQRSSEQLQRLIGDLLDFTSSGNRKMEISEDTLLLDAFATEVRQSTCIMSGVSENVITVSLEQGLPRAVVADRVRLLQVVLNLIENANKYTRAGRIDLQISREAEPITHNFNGRIPLRFEVVDDGEGIPPENQASVFEPFARGGNAHGIPGLGLGLTIAREWVRAMGGELRFESIPQLGARFYFTLRLPVTTPPQREVAEWHCRACMDTLEAASGAVLVADDSSENRLYLRDLCEGWGYPVVEAEDGDSALKMIQSEPACFSAVLIDQIMPRMDGWHFLKQLRNSISSADLPVILLSASVPQRPANYPETLDFDFSLEKPFTVAALACFLCKRLRRLDKIPDDCPYAEPANSTMLSIALPVEQRRVFRELFEMGKLLRIEQWAKELAMTDLVFQPLSLKLVRYCQEANLPELKRLLESLEGAKLF